MAEGQWDSFNWSAPKTLYPGLFKPQNIMPHFSNLFYFQDQADQSKQVTYSVSGDSGFKVNIEEMTDLVQLEKKLLHKILVY